MHTDEAIRADYAGNWAAVHLTSDLCPAPCSSAAASVRHRLSSHLVCSARHTQVMLGPQRFCAAAANSTRADHPDACHLAQSNGGTAGLVSLLSSFKCRAVEQAAWALACLSNERSARRFPITPATQFARCCALWTTLRRPITLHFTQRSRWATSRPLRASRTLHAGSRPFCQLMSPTRTRACATSSSIFLPSNLFLANYSLHSLQTKFGMVSMCIKTCNSPMMPIDKPIINAPASTGTRCRAAACLSDR